ncbi:MAG: Gfo/Idh/MocA family oxidoreductase [Fimbriimonadaceae bacterium]
MPVRVGFYSVAHMHAWGYAGGIRRHPEAELVGVWEPDADLAARFASDFECETFADPDAMLGAVDAVVITSDNKRHAPYGEAAARAGRHILCEKPLVTSASEAARLLGAVRETGVKLMTAFPCRYSPAWRRLKERVRAGDIGKVLAICATNRGTCPHGWFVEAERSGGGAMIDHVVHVADLLGDLLGEAPHKVQAQIGNRMYGQDWEDTAMLTLEFPSGVFATLDSSWSRPPTFKTWGDVTMNVVGESGVIELDMFNQGIDVYRSGSPTHTLSAYGSDLDAGLVDAFIRCIVDDTDPPVSGADGWRAARVALAGYESAQTGQPVSVAPD